MKPLAWSALLSLALVTAPSANAEETPKPAPEKSAAQVALPDYIRFAQDQHSQRLEVACKTFAVRGEATVDLLGVVHIADADYYADLNKRLAGYDAVLFELVGDPEDLKKAQAAKEDGTRKRSAISFVQDSLGKFLKLQFQLSGIDYSKPNMVHADTSAEEFADMQKERGETMLKLLVRAMQIQLNGELDKEAEALQELDTFRLLRLLMSKDSAREFKIILAKMFDQAETLTAKLEGKEGSAILSGRNETVVKKLKEVLAEGTRKKIAIFYGAAHMPGVEKLITEELEAQPKGETWLPAWTMIPAEEPPKKDKPKIKTL